MKKLFMVLLTITTLISAQAQSNEGQEPGRKAQFTPEQKAKLKAKQMTLALTLSDKQQQQVEKLYLTEIKSKGDIQVKARKSDSSVRTMTPEQRFDRMNAQLDQRIEKNRKFQSILTAEQFEKYQLMQNEKWHSHKKYAMQHRQKMDQRQRSKTRK